jgi:hypothetical protein
MAVLGPGGRFPDGTRAPQAGDPGVVRVPSNVGADKVVDWLTEQGLIDLHSILPESECVCPVCAEQARYDALSDTEKAAEWEKALADEEDGLF